MRLETVGKRYGMRQPWVVRGVTAELPAGRSAPVLTGTQKGRASSSNMG